MRVRLEALGCRLNTSEIEHLGRRFLSQGDQVIVDGDEAADVCILNSCAVTHVAARKSRQLIRSLRRQYPNATVVVTGCYAHLSPEEVKEAGADLVFDNVQKEHLFDLLQARLKGQTVMPPAETSSVTIGGVLPGGRTRAFVKVQDGCNQHCTYCVVTILRGRSRSRPAVEIVTEIGELVQAGYKEVVLSGVHLGAFGKDTGDGAGLTELVRRILSETDISRLRLSSLEPWDIPPGFFDLWRDERLGRHLHLPLQSGCNATLRRMGRHADSESYARLVETARAAMPDLSITTDVMVGFPGETEEEFEQSLDFVRAIQFSGLHVFRFSPRPGTKAAAMPGQVPPGEAGERSLRMHQEGKRLQQEFLNRFLGRTVQVLWETGQPVDSGWLWHGLSENYLRVSTISGPGLRNVITSVIVESIAAGELRGSILKGAAGLGDDRR